MGSHLTIIESVPEDVARTKFSKSRSLNLALSSEICRRSKDLLAPNSTSTDRRCVAPMSAHASGKTSEGLAESGLRLAGLPAAFVPAPYEDAAASAALRRAISVNAAVSSGERHLLADLHAQTRDRDLFQNYLLQAPRRSFHQQ